MKILGVAIVMVFLGSNPALAIVGGSETSPSDPVSKNTVFLKHGKAGQYDGDDCVGVIIAEDSVLTTCTCASPRQNSPFKIVFGTNVEATAPANIREPSKVLCKPEHQVGWQDDDIAVVRFKGGLPSTYEAVKLLAEPSLGKTAARVIFAGYGHTTTDYYNWNGYGVLRKIEKAVDPTIQRGDEFLVRFDQYEGWEKGTGVSATDYGAPGFIEKNGALYLWGNFTYCSYSRPFPASCFDWVSFNNLYLHLDWIKSVAKVSF